MPPGQPEKESHPVKRHRRSRSLNMTQPHEVIDLTKPSWQTAELETGGLRKHDRQEHDSQDDGPIKRAKLQRNSEPPTCKETSKPPRRKQRRSRKGIDYQKASRTRKHHELQHSNRTLERELWNTKQGLNSNKQEHKDTKQLLQWTAYEYNRIRKLWKEQAEEMRKRDRIIKTSRKEAQSLKAAVDDPVNGVNAFQEYRQRKDEELKSKDGTIAAQKEELVEARKDREQAVQENEAARTLNDSNGSRNEKLAKKERTATNNLKKEREEHRKAISAFEAQKVELEQRCTEMNTKLKKQENKYSGMIARLQQELRDALPQSQRFNFKVSDDEVQHDFIALGCKIRQFVFKHTRTVLNVTDQELQFVWPGWSPALRDFLASRILCNLVLEAHIWEQLLERVFTPWSHLWVGELGQPLENVLRMAGAESEKAGFESETYAHYQYLRSSSSSFIRRLNGEDFRPEDIDPVVNAMVSTMQKLCRLPKVTNSMQADAIGIFKHARDFEVLLRKQKAAYSFCMVKTTPSGEVYKHGLSFDDESMVDRSPSQSDKKDGQVQRVDFIKSPGLRKRGNNDGDKYEDDTWLVKMGVVCDAERFFLGSNNSNTAGPIPVQTSKALQSSEMKQEDKDQDVVLQCHTDTTATTNVTTRSQAPPNTDSKLHDKRSNTKSTKNHPHPTGAARGRGGGSSGKKTRKSKESDPNAAYVPKS